MVDVRFLLERGIWTSQHIFQPNVGKYTIHGSYGVFNTFLIFTLIKWRDDPIRRTYFSNGRFNHQLVVFSFLSLEMYKAELFCRVPKGGCSRGGVTGEP